MQVIMTATPTPSVRTQTVATRAAVLTVTREMERTAQVRVYFPLCYFDVFAYRILTSFYLLLMFVNINKFYYYDKVNKLTAMEQN